MSKSALTLRADLISRLLAGEFDGIIMDRLGWLMHTVPAADKVRDDLLQQTEAFCLEAIEIFDPARNAKFSTFLTGHLKKYCGNYQRYLWIRSSGNENCRTLPIHGNGSDPIGSLKHKSFRNDSDSIAIDGGRVHVDEFTVQSEAEGVAILNEFISSPTLTPSIKEFVQSLCEHPDRPAVLNALLPGKTAGKLRDLGFDYRQAQKFVKFRKRRLKPLERHYVAV
jgi:hypothetical protein